MGVFQIESGKIDAWMGAVAIILAMAPVFTFAAEGEARAGHGHFSVGYQVISVDGFQSSIGELPIGTVDTHSMNFEVDYYLNDKWSLIAGIPYVRKRYNGPGQHDPLKLDPPRPEIENVDTGAWNNGFQDFHVGVRYLAKEGLFSVEPYVFLGAPSNQYPFFGHAAVGQQLLKLYVGSAFTWAPGLSDAYYRVDTSYVFVEETLGTNINHWLIGAEAGYYFKPRLSGRIFMLLKHGNGLIFPDDFPPPRTGEDWYQHDRMVKHNFMNAGLGLDWAMGERYQLSTNVMTMVWADQVHIMDYTFSLSLARSF